MALYAIADLHLSTLDSTDKSMEVFGRRWDGYMKKLKSNWENLITDEDTVVIPGDVSWALSLEEAISDLKFIDALPGKKILGKGNHDFWWSTMNKHYKLFEKENISTISFLFNNAHLVGDYIVAGTRGWYHDDEARNAPDNADFEKLTNREALRLRASLDAAMKLKEEDENRKIIVFMHFPPYWNGKESEGIIDILHEYGISDVYFGHIHGNYTVEPTIERGGLKMHLIAADYIQFIPKIIKIQ